MKLKEQIEAIDSTIHLLLHLAEGGADIMLDTLIGLNSAKYELEGLMQERELAGRQ